jgi:hypothetical protein
MSHRNHVAWSNKEMRLPELEMLRLADQLRRAQHYKEAIQPSAAASAVPAGWAEPSLITSCPFR